MRLTSIAVIGIIVLVALVLWQTGLAKALTFWAAEQQRDFQNAMAAAVQALRRGDSAALWTLVGLSASYGFVHAVGPGHGKILIGGAALAGQAPIFKMLGLSLIASLGQSATALILVYGGFLLLSLSAAQMVEAADDWLAPLSYLIIAAIGVVIVLRGLRALLRSFNGAVSEANAEEAACGCGHAHGPSLEQAAQPMTLRETLSMIASIAIRPCTGAVFLLVIAWKLDLILAGTIAVVAMGLGTAAFNCAVAAAGVFMHRTSLVAAGSGKGVGLHRPLAILQVAGGALIMMFSGALFAGSVSF